jgi:hypothetical protein
VSSRLKGVVVALVFVSACGGLTISRQGTTVEYPVKAHKVLHLFACTAVDFPGEPTHVTRGRIVKFQMTNGCGTKYSMGIQDNDALFTGAQTLSVEVDPGQTVTLPLTVSMTAALGSHKADIIFRGKNHDPRFEVDP